MKSDKSETLRKKALEANSLSAAIVVSSDDAIIGKTQDGIILSWNFGAQKIYGYSFDEVKGRSISILVPPDKTDEVPQLLQRISQGQRIEHYKTMHMRKDGKQIDVLLTISPIKDPTGKIIGASTIARDITEHRRTEEAIRESEERYCSLIESANDIIATVSPDGIIISLNPAFERITGWAREKWLGKGFPPLIHPDDLPKASDVFQHTMSGETMPGSELRLLTNSGGYVYVEYMTAPLLKDGKVIGNLNIVRDITERKRAQEALHRAHDELEIRVKERTVELEKANEALQAETTEHRLAKEKIEQANIKIANILESISDGFISLDTEWRFRYVNHRAANNIGFTPEELIGQNIWEKFPKLIGTSHEVNYRKAMDARIESHFELKGVLTDEWYEIRVYPSSEGITIYWLDITERKRTEEALRKSEEKFRLIATNSPDVVFFQDCDLRYVWMINPAPPFTEEQVIGKTDLDLLNREEAERLIEIKRMILDTGAGARVEIPLIIGGKKYYYDAVYEPTQDHEGRILGIFGYAHNITERKLAEKALQESEQKYRELVKHAPTAIYEVDFRSQRFVSVNDAMCQILGYTREELLAMNPFDLLDDLSKLTFQERITKWLSGEMSDTNIEYTVKTKDGREICMILNVTFTSDVNGQPIGATVIGHDITERKRAEEALREAHDELELRVQERTAELKEANKALLESEASYRELAESIDDLFFAMDRDLRYTYWNKACEALTGISAKDAIGKSLYELFPDIKGTKVDQFHIEVLKTQQPASFENEYQLGDKKIIFDINAYPIKTGISVIAKDITERKMFEAHLLHAQRMESIGILAGGIAHNLNNMLTPMMMSLRMLKEKLKDEQSQKLLTILEKNSERSADLVKQVLSFSGGVEGERTPLQIAHIIAEIEKIAKETFPKNIDIRTDIPKDLWTISGDDTQLHQVIMNLCVNARDAMPDGGILSISAENFFIDENYARMHTEAKVGSYVTIAALDNGIGIPPKILDRIFEPFFTTKEFGKGTGLGLSTALAIVKSHGGFINVYSEVGKGTTFRVYLPAIKTEAEMQDVEEQKLELLVGHGELVLVAEDEDSIRDVTISILKKYGYEVLAANDGADAVALYAQNTDKTKVILMDMMMPVMDGHASIKAVRKINPEVKIITVSGLAEKEKLKNVADYTNAFLPKPYTAERLLKTVYEVLSAK